MRRMTDLQFEILTVLGSERLHGYALINKIEESMSKRPAVATVYAALEKLQGVQWIAPDGDEIVDGRVRRYFTLTERGAAALKADAEVLARRAKAAQKWLFTNEGVGGV